MATNEFEQPAAPPVRVTIVKAAHDLTGTDARFSLRLLAATILIAASGSTAPMPFALLIAIGVVVMAIEVARLAWHR